MPREQSKRPVQAAKDFLEHTLDALPEHGVYLDGNLIPTLIASDAAFTLTRKNSYRELLPFLVNLERSAVQANIVPADDDEFLLLMVFLNQAGVPASIGSAAELHQYVNKPAGEEIISMKSAESIFRQMQELDTKVKEASKIPQLFELLEQIAAGAKFGELPGDWRNILKEGMRTLAFLSKIIEKQQSDPTTDLSVAPESAWNDERRAVAETRSSEGYGQIAPQMEQLLDGYEEVMTACLMAAGVGKRRRR